ncbi:dihydrofolate reductase family protein [Nonomuraea sp. NPDC004354]
MATSPPGWTPSPSTSASLSDPGWNSVVIKGEVAEQVARLEREPSRDLLVYGSATLVNHLITHGLIDELKLLLRPVVVPASPNGCRCACWPRRRGAANGASPGCSTARPGSPRWPIRPPCAPGTCRTPHTAARHHRGRRQGGRLRGYRMLRRLRARAATLDHP